MRSNIFACFGRITFKLGKLLNFKALFPAVLMDILFLLLVKTWNKTWKVLLHYVRIKWSGFKSRLEIKSVLFTERTCYEWHGDDLPKLRRTVFAKWGHQRGRYLSLLFINGMATLIQATLFKFLFEMKKRWNLKN